MKEIKRLIKVQVVRKSEGSINFYPIGFKLGAADVSGCTAIEFKNDTPLSMLSFDRFNIIDNVINILTDCLLGDPIVKWKYNSNPGKNTFELYLPDDRVKSAMFDRAIENSEEIQFWIKLWYKLYDIKNDIAFLSMMGTNSDDNQMELKYLKTRSNEIELQLSELWDKFDRMGLTIDRNTLVNPMYLFVIPTEKLKNAVYECKNSGVDWLTPNVCMTRSKEAILNLINTYYREDETFE